MRSIFGRLYANVTRTHGLLIPLTFFRKKMYDCRVCTLV